VAGQQGAAVPEAAAESARAAPRACAECGRSLACKRRDAKYCSYTCSNRAAQRRRRERLRCQGCMRGHPWTDENTYVAPDGRRRCRTCRRRRGRERKHRLRVVRGDPGARARESNRRWRSRNREKERARHRAYKRRLKARDT
jgi:hypothetical protein